MDIYTNDKIISWITGKPYTGKYNWGNIILHLFSHTTGPLAIYFLYTEAHWLTSVYCLFLHACGMVGIAGGAHRLWSHHSYKANLPFRVILMLCQTSAIELDIMSWVRWHRCHHKWTDTNADPHNINRGFFFSHIGWTMVRPHPEFEAKKDLIDMSDLEKDSVAVFQNKYYYQLVFVMYLFSTVVPMYFWGETWTITMCQTNLHFLLTSHIIYMTNSLNHIDHIGPFHVGSKKFDSKITASTTLLGILSGGDGYHNFHHVFPMDYRTSSEEDAYLNPMTKFIDFFAMLGWVSDRKITPKETVLKKKIENMKNSNIRYEDVVRG